MTTVPRTYVDIHVLQTVPPSNLNRDDAGSPKQAIYGGVRRARVSSQAWKRATRTAFAERLPKEQLATRTKRISTLLADRLTARFGLGPEAAAQISTHLLADLKITPGKKATETAYLLFFGRPQIDAIADLVADSINELAGLDDAELKKAVEGLPVRETLSTGHPIDVALFGRMVADLSGLNVDAAVQVAHALSTHRVDTEFDYYTAVDDENTDSTGAGMIGTIEFTSATLYRFATVGLHQLLENLGDDTEAAGAALEVFLDSFIRSMPTGHENSFAHRTVPQLVTVAIRADQPVNLVSAFEAPVRGNGAGIATGSVTRFAAELSKAESLWGLTPLTLASCYDLPDADEQAARDALGAPVPLPELIATVVSSARQRLIPVAGSDR